MKNYVFNIAPDTSLSSLRVNRRPLTLKPGVPQLQRARRGRVHGAAIVDAVATDPAATVTVDAGPGHRDQRQRVLGLHGERQPDHPARHLLRRAPGRRAPTRAADGTVVITSQPGDLQGTTNTARNLVLQDVNGDWTMESKVVFSRALAANNEQGGIVAYADDQNYVKLAWEMSSVTQAINKLRVVFLREQNGTATTFQVTGSDAQRIVGAGGAIWLRIAKSGSTLQGVLLVRRRRLAVLRDDDAERRAGAGGAARVQPRRDVDGPRRRVRGLRGRAASGEVVPSLIAEAPGTVGGTVPATLSLSLGAPATFGAVRAGRRARVHGVDDRDGDLHGRRRGADGERSRPAGQRRVLAPAAAGGLVLAVGVERARVQRRRST